MASSRNPAHLVVAVILVFVVVVVVVVVFMVIVLLVVFVFVVPLIVVGLANALFCKEVQYEGKRTCTVE
jgi:hypothetical protein